MIIDLIFGISLISLGLLYLFKIFSHSSSNTLFYKICTVFYLIFGISIIWNYLHT
jgi:hypothetical protein